MIEFFFSYPLWARLLALALFAAIFLLAAIVPRAKTTDVAQTPTPPVQHQPVTFNFINNDQHGGSFTGIHAENLFINGSAQPTWKFSVELGDAILGELNKFPPQPQPVSVKAVQGDDSAYELAEQLIKFLSGKGVQVGSRAPGGFSHSGKNMHGIAVLRDAGNPAGARMEIRIGNAPKP